MQGKLITFEGLDGCGKTTQLSLLFDYLKSQGQKVEILREPGGNKISESIREILLDNKNSSMTSETELLLYAASRAQIVKEKIKPLIDDGYIVLCDRFYDSTTAYQGYGRKINLEFINQLNNFAVLEGKFNPDITFFIDLPPHFSFERVFKRGEKLNRMEKAGETFFNDVYNGFKEISNNYKDRVITLNGTKSIEELFNDIREVVNTRLNL